MASEVGAGQIYAKLGDTLTAKYKDEYPADYPTTEKAKTFTATAAVGVVVPLPIETVKPSLVDPETGEALVAGKVGEMVMLRTTVTNVATVEKSFTVLFKVVDEAGVTVHIGLAEGSLAGGASFSFGSSWTPTAAGTYKVYAYVWKSLAEPGVVLSEPVVSEIVVTE